jgi:hypothetical protein
MKISITDCFNIDKNKFEETGAFDAVLGIDTRLFVDPFLIPYTKTEELKGGRDKALEYFSKILRLLLATKSKDDATWKAAKKSLKFHETPGFNFGYSQKTGGSAFGDRLTNRVLETAYEIVKKGIEDPIIFELVGIFEEGIGCDRISDMYCRILFDDFSSFTLRVFKSLGIEVKPVIIKGRKLILPTNPYKPEEPILLVPKDILRELPIAYDFSDIYLVCAANEELRKKLNSLLGDDWSEKLKKYKKRGIKRFLLENPTYLSYLISEYKKSKPQKYNFRTDPSGEATWYERSKKITSENPIRLTLSKNPSIDDLENVVDEVCKKFKNLIEDNGQWEFLYKENGKPKPERSAQLLFFGVADFYCEKNNLSLSREANAGRGPVDFKIADGNLNYLVEIKLSTNKKLIHAYETQVPLYTKSERSSGAIILVLEVVEKSNVLEALLKRKNEDGLKKIEGPKVIVINAKPKKSASKA